jgi:hypothetical protein
VRAADIQSDDHASIQVLAERLGNAIAAVCPIVSDRGHMAPSGRRSARSSAKSAREQLQ